jgi:hypothetical protein
VSGINDSLNWDLVRRQTYTAIPGPETSYFPIPPITVICESHLMMFGFRNDEAKKTWWLAATVSQRLLTLPSSTSEFLASVEAFNQRCGLRQLTLIKFPNWGLLPFLAEINIPKWHKQMYVEVWKYSGDEDFDVIQQSLNKINTLIELIGE